MIGSAQNAQKLAQQIWDLTWPTLYANGTHCTREKAAAAIEAYNRIGYAEFMRHSRQSEIKSSEALANMICQAARYGIQPAVDSPELVQRMVKAYHMLHTQWTTGGFVGNLFFEGLFTVTSADYRWFGSLNRSS